MNNTKWLELKVAMSSLNEVSPKWKTRCLDNGYETEHWDGDWCYHFSAGGFNDIEWVEIKVEGVDHKSKVLSKLQKIHVPGHETEHGFKVYGYIKEGQVVDYL